MAARCGSNASGSASLSLPSIEPSGRGAPDANNRRPRSSLTGGGARRGATGTPVGSLWPAVFDDGDLELRRPSRAGAESIAIVAAAVPR